MDIKLPQIEPEIVCKEIGDFIVEKILYAGKTGGIIGLSGGIDSTTVAFLAKKAFDDYNNSNTTKLKLFGFIMPSEINSKNDIEDGINVAKILGINYKKILIENIIKIFKKSIPEFIIKDYDKGNLSSECRAIILSRAAAYHNGLILGTGNRDEDYCLGYFTKRGDGQVDISPIGDLSKRHVREVASYLGVPNHIINKAPTAGLWEHQTDESELGFSYLEVEKVIMAKDRGYDSGQIESMFNFGYVRKIGEEKTLIVDKILDMHKNNKHKLNMPPIAKVAKF